MIVSSIIAHNCLMKQKHDIQILSIFIFRFAVVVVCQWNNLQICFSFFYLKLLANMFLPFANMCFCLFRANLETNMTKVIIEDNISYPDGLAVDWVHGNLYICDTGLDKIEVARLDGTHRKTLISEDLYEPKALVLDPSSGYVICFNWCHFCIILCRLFTFFFFTLILKPFISTNIANLFY